MNLGPFIKPKPHYALLEYVAKQCPLGTALEFGVATGTSTRIIAKYMPVIGFGSALGLPEDWRPGFGKGAFAHPTPTIPGVQMVEGLFEDTLPGFDFAAVKPIVLCHCDADLYSSTKTVLDHVGPHLESGTYIVFDEYHGWPGWETGGEYLAWQEFVRDTGIQFDAVGHSHEAAAFRIR